MCDRCGLKRCRTRESWLTDRCAVLRCRTTLTPMRSRCQTHFSHIFVIIVGCRTQRDIRHITHSTADNFSTCKESQSIPKNPKESRNESTFAPSTTKSPQSFQQVRTIPNVEQSEQGSVRILKESLKLGEYFLIIKNPETVPSHLY